MGRIAGERNMEYAELTVSTTTAGAEVVSNLMLELGAVGTQILDRADLPDPNHPGAYWELMDQSVIDAMPEDVEVKVWYEVNEKLPGIIETLKTRLQMMKAAGGDWGTLELSTQNVESKDWSECWKQYYKPFRLGKHIVIKPSWEDWKKEDGDLIIELDPGMAFGTGTHETTAMCVEMIEDYYAGGKMLDIGTGSGILAIAAARLGAKDVVAVDIDPDAVRVAQENVERCGVKDRVLVKEGDLLQGLNESFGFAVANILAPVICMLAGPLKNHLLPGSLFVCSGIIAEAEEDVKKALLENGYEILEIRHKGEWVAMTSRRN